MMKKIELNKIFGVFMTSQEIQEYYEEKGFSVVTKELRSGAKAPAVVLPEKPGSRETKCTSYWIVPELWRIDGRGDLIDPLTPYHFNVGAEESVWNSTKRSDVRSYASMRSVQYGCDSQTFVIVPLDQATHLYFSDWLNDRYYSDCSVCEVVRVGKIQKAILDLAIRDLTDLQQNMEQYQLYAEEAPEFAEIIRSLRPAAERYGLLLDFDRYPNKAAGYKLGSQILRGYREYFQSYDQLTDDLKGQIRSGFIPTCIFYYDQAGVDELLSFCASKHHSSKIF